MSSDPGTAHFVREIRLAYRYELGRERTHYEGCYRAHPWCAMRLLLDLVDPDDHTSNNPQGSEQP